MKTKLLLVLVVLTGGLQIAEANHLGSVLRLTMAGNARYTVRIDNAPSTRPGRYFEFEELMPGHHRVRILRLNGNAYGHGPRPGYNRLVFDGDIFVPEGSEVSAVVERGCLRIMDIQPLFPAGCGPHCYDEHPAGHCGTPVPFTDEFEVYPLSNAEFEELYAAVSNRPFESTRTEIACRLIRERHLTAQQVARLLDIFTFDANKLEVAKAAYARTVDRDRYYVVFNAFTFESSILELSRFMENYG
jgi:hypothetical protein